MTRARHLAAALALAALTTAASCRTEYYGLRLFAPRGRSATPTLRWQPAANCHYDLRIFAERDAELVYERIDLPDAEHTVETALAAGRYRWTVRPRRGTGVDARVGIWTIERDDQLPRQWSHPLPKLLMAELIVND